VGTGRPFPGVKRGRGVSVTLADKNEQELYLHGVYRESFTFFFTFIA
jgi:hypothetical protein